MSDFILVRARGVSFLEDFFDRIPRFVESVRELSGTTRESAQDAVRRRLRRHLKMFVIPGNVSADFADALFRRGHLQRDIGAHVCWVDRVIFAPGAMLPEVDVRGLFRVPFRRKLTREWLKELEQRFERLFTDAVSVELVSGDAGTMHDTIEHIEAIPVGGIGECRALGWRSIAAHPAYGMRR